MVSMLVEDIPDEDWQEFKDSIPRSTSLEEAFRQIVAGEVLEVTTDDEGRVELGQEYAGETVRMHVVRLEADGDE